MENSRIVRLFAPHHHRRAGHSSLSTTANYYRHLFPSENHKAGMDAIAGELVG